MKALSRQAVARGLWLSALACITASLYLMYKAGCTGDLKGASLGDFAGALEIESDGILFSWLGIILAAIAAASRGEIVLHQRVAAVVAVLLLGVVGLTIVGIQLEVWGVQRCLIPK